MGTYKMVETGNLPILTGNYCRLDIDWTEHILYLT